MILFRITNALLGVMAALWWFFNRHSDMAEPIVAVIGCSIVVIEILGEVIAARVKSHHEAQASMESEVLPKVLDRIEREESNIQQVIGGKRKQDKIIEEYPIELIEPHVIELRKLKRFSRIAGRLHKELVRNKELPAGAKQFDELQAVLHEIKLLASRSYAGGKNLFCAIYVALALCVGTYGAAFVRLPLDGRSGTQNEEKSVKSPNADDRDASKVDK